MNCQKEKCSKILNGALNFNELRCFGKPRKKKFQT